MFPTIAQVALGGAIGASVRYMVNISSQRLFGAGFPFHTMIVNVLGSFLMGALVAILAHKGGMRFAPFLMTGVLGGFTTFSAFSLDTFTLWERGQHMAAAGYVAGSVILSLGAMLGGVLTFRSILT